MRLSVWWWILNQLVSMAGKPCWCIRCQSQFQKFWRPTIVSPCTRVTKRCGSNALNNFCYALPYDSKWWCDNRPFLLKEVMEALKGGHRTSSSRTAIATAFQTKRRNIHNQLHKLNNFSLYVLNCASIGKKFVLFETVAITVGAHQGTPPCLQSKLP